MGMLSWAAGSKKDGYCFSSEFKVIKLISAFSISQSATQPKKAIENMRIC